MRRGKILIGGLIILFGLAALADNLGWWRIDLLGGLVEYWPLLLIGAGVALLAGARWRWWIMAVILLVIGVAVLGAWRWPGGVVHSTFGPPTGHPAITAVRAEIATVDASVRMAPGAGGGTAFGFEVAHRAGGAKHSFDVVDGVAEVELSTRFGGGRKAAELGMDYDPGLPLDLTLRVVAGQVDLDLRRHVKLRSLAVDNTAGEVELRLPAPEGQLDVRVTQSVGQIEVWVPAATGLRVRGRTRIGQLDLDAGGLRAVDGYWQNEAYEEATSRLDLNLATTVGQVSIRRYQPD